MVSIDEADPDALTVTCGLPQQNLTVRIPFPALIAVEKEVFEPRLPSYRLKLASAGRAIETVALKDLADTDETHYGQNGSPTRVVRIFPPENDTVQERWEGSGAELGERLYAFLRDHKFLQQPR